MWQAGWGECGKTKIHGRQLVLQSVAIVTVATTFRSQCHDMNTTSSESRLNANKFCNYTIYFKIYDIYLYDIRAHDLSTHQRSQ